MQRAILHWFWRGLIAVVLAFAANMVISFLLGRLVSPGTWSQWPFFVSVAVSRLAIAVAIYGVLTHKYGHRVADDETRCRACDYILRGIPEPRCPECGEVI